MVSLLPWMTLDRRHGRLQVSWPEEDGHGGWSPATDASSHDTWLKVQNKEIENR
jgi:hypothetical protein